VSCYLEKNLPTKKPVSPHPHPLSCIRKDVYGPSSVIRKDVYGYSSVISGERKNKALLCCVRRQLITFYAPKKYFAPKNVIFSRQKQ
jgi:hypothetical protein